VYSGNLTLSLDVTSFMIEDKSTNAALQTKIAALEQEILKLRRFEKVSQTLNNISKSVNFADTLNDLCLSIQAALGEIIDTSHFSIILVEKNDGSLRLQYPTNRFNNRLRCHDINATLAAAVIKAGQPAWAAGEGVIEALERLGLSATNTADCKSWLGVPLCLRDRVMGAMTVWSDVDSNRFYQEDLDLMVLATDHVAAAIDHKRADQALSESEERYRRLVENATDAIYLADVKGNILNVNKAACEILQFTEKELLQLNLFDLSPDHTKSQYNAFLESEPDDTPTLIESKHRKKDGTFFPVEINLVAYTQDDNRYILGVARDISTRKKAEAEVMASAERVQRFFSSIDDAIFVHPLLEEGFGPILEVNDIACIRYGYTRQEYASMTAKDISKPAHTQRYGSANFRKRLLEAGKIIFEAVHVKKNGDEFPVEINASVVEQYGKPFILSVVRDITDRKNAQQERKKLESQLIQSQKMESIGQLAGGVAHDLNNLLTPILGYSELLKLELDESEEQKRILEEIIGAGKRARDLVRQLLAFSRKQTLAYKSVDINWVIDNIRKLLVRTIKENVHINVHSGLDLPLIKADVGQIEQVIMNLSVNAADAMPHGGTLTIETSPLFADPSYAQARLGMTPGAYILLSVSDTGAGMDDETRQNVFEPFFTTKEHGTGLGMATVFGIVKQHNGYIDVYSELEKGTTFNVYLPITGDAVTAEKALERETIADLRGSETILLAEDNAHVRNLTYDILKSQGYNVLLAGSGKEALEVFYAYDGQIDLLLSDVIMPTMNGKELYNRIRESAPSIKLIYMSGYPQDVISHHGVLEKGTHFIQKPFSSIEIAKQIRMVLED
jgi:PAS domain S-box-containing protein